MRGEGGRSRRVGRGDGAASEHRLLPSLSSESRPEGHPLEGLRVNKPAVRQYEIHPPSSMVIEKYHRCTQNKHPTQRKYHPPETTEKEKENKKEKGTAVPPGNQKISMDK